jgi:Putative bacterial sensory transduction regulator/zinc-ribbon domain
MLCPRCGAESLATQAFCTKCGAALGASGNPQSAAPAASASTPPAVPQPASLHAIPDGGLTMEEVVAWLQSGGYAAKVVAAADGKRHIISNSHGTPFDIFTPGCLSGRCASIELVVAFSCKGRFDVSQLNAWNSEVPWCKAYYDSVNDPSLDMDIALSPGGTYESLNDQFMTWNTVLGRFIAKYDLR